MARKKKSYLYVKKLTYSQKQVVKGLINGGNIAHMGTSGIRLRDKDQNPLSRVTARTFFKLREIIRKDKNRLWVLSGPAVNKMNPLSWLHKEYTKFLNSKI